MNPMKHVDVLIERYPELESQRENILEAYKILEESYANGGKLLIAGNGGSAADAEHIVGELMKGFENPRKLKEVEVEKLMDVNVELYCHSFSSNLCRCYSGVCRARHPHLQH